MRLIIEEDGRWLGFATTHERVVERTSYSLECEIKMSDEQARALLASLQAHFKAKDAAVYPEKDKCHSVLLLEAAAARFPVGSKARVLHVTDSSFRQPNINDGDVVFILNKPSPYYVYGMCVLVKKDNLILNATVCDRQPIEDCDASAFTFTHHRGWAEERCEEMVKPSLGSEYPAADGPALLSKPASACTCSLADLMAGGCKCGQMQREKQ